MIHNKGPLDKYKLKKNIININNDDKKNTGIN